MLYEQLDSRFLFPNPLLPLGEFLMKFSEQSLFPVAVRSLESSNRVQDMKVIMHNNISGMLRGFKPGGQVGMTISDILDTLDMSKENKEAEIEAIDQNDQEAISNNCQSAHNQVTLDAKGFIRIFKRIVTPLSGYNGKIIALSTTSLELTQYTNLLHLFALYKRYYQNYSDKEATAIQRFSTYLKLDTYFTSLLTVNEMTVLLAMATDSRHKQVSELISCFSKKPCAPKTISTYTQLIQEKLKAGINVHAVLRNLRDYYQVQAMLFEPL